MNQQIRSIIFGVAGLLVLAGAILFLTHWAVAPYLFAVGAAAPPFQRIRRTSNDRIFRLYVQQPYRVDPLLERSRYLTDIYRFRYS